MAKNIEIRNSTAEFLIFQLEGKEDGVQVMYQNETIWCTQKAMAQLFDCTTDNVGLHLKNIYESGELMQDATTEYFSVIQVEGKRQENRKLKFYNLDAVISVGYRVNSTRATQFRQWCTFVLRQFAIRGYVIDIYATAIDYNKDAPTTRLFFKKVQNKMHYAIHGHTAAELIVERANADKEHMGLTTWENAPNGKIVKTDVSVAKNYLRENELEEMGRIVNASLDMAENMAKRHIPMTMEDWAKRIDKFIDVAELPILQDNGNVSAEFAKEFAETEFEKYRIIQDKLFQSDFDRFSDGNLLPLDIE